MRQNIIHKNISILAILILSFWTVSCTGGTPQVDKNALISPALGNFTLKGVPGEGQKNKYILRYVGKDKLEKWSSKRSSKKISDELPLNMKTQLPTGFYVIVYEGSMMFIEVKEGEDVEVNLERIDIAPKGYKYSVYMDFSSEKQRLVIQRVMWVGASQELKKIEKFCYDSGLLKREREYCDLVLSKDFNVFSKIMKFTDDSEFLIRDGKCSSTKCDFIFVDWKNEGRLYTSAKASSRKKKETFVSVLPGDYKVEFTR